MTSVSQRAFLDSLIRHQIFLAGYSQHVTDILRKDLDASTEKIQTLIALELGANDTQMQTIKKMRELERKIATFRQVAWGMIFDKIAGLQLVEAISYEPEFLQQAIGADKDQWQVPDTSGLIGSTLIVGRTLADNFKQIQRSDIGRLIVQFRLGYLGRQTSSKVVHLMKHPMGVSLNSLATIVAAAVLALTQAARDKAVAANPAFFTDKEQWVSILDKDTTEGCRKLNGKIFSKNTGPKVGYHWGCRSDRVPVAAGDSTDTSTPENFADWVATQPQSFQSFLRKNKTTYNQRDVPSITLNQVISKDAQT